MDFFSRFSGSHLIAAHRGFRSIYPENTRCAFEAAANRCDFIELDVQLSEDLLPVIIHDTDLTRTSNAATMAVPLGKTSLQVTNWRLAELRTLDMGGWFCKADPFKTIAAGIIDPEILKPLMPQTIMTLGELLSWAVKKSIPINIELKESAETRDNGQQIVDIVLDVIYRENAAEMVLLSSFNHEFLRKIHQDAPELSTAALIGTEPPPGLMNYLDALGVCACHALDRKVNTSFIAALRNAGFIVNVYTVNDRKRQDELYELGATAIFTDFLLRPGD